MIQEEKQNTITLIRKFIFVDGDTMSRREMCEACDVPGVCSRLCDKRYRLDKRDGYFKELTDET